MERYGNIYKNIDKYTNENVEDAFYVNNTTLRYNGERARKSRLNKERILADRARTRNRRAKGVPELKRSSGQRNLLAATRTNNLTRRHSRVRNWMPNGLDNVSGYPRSNNYTRTHSQVRNWMPKP